MTERRPTPAAPTQPAELLRRFEPIVRFDTREQYFPLSAAAWTDCPGNQLRRADGTVLATRAPGATPLLALAFLGPQRYADGTPVAPGDAIACPGRDYLAKARRLQADPGYADRVYGRAQTGSDGRLWLQYRWFYFFNDYRMLVRRLPVGLHEGDWEMIQLRLDAAGTVPELALYLHHRTIQRRAWPALERVGERPVVYVARGSHGCYVTAGTHWTGTWFDHADGRVARETQTLEIVADDPADDWIRWPGAWGGTRPRPGPFGRADGESPAGPGAAVHVRWRDPAVLLARATD